MDSSVNTPPVTLTVRMIMQGKEVGSIIGKKVSAIFVHCIYDDYDYY